MKGQWWYLFYIPSVTAIRKFHCKQLFWHRAYSLTFEKPCSNVNFVSNATYAKIYEFLNETAPWTIEE